MTDPCEPAWLGNPIHGSCQGPAVRWYGERVSAPQPPGWYPDATGSMRYWDGVQWTSHTTEGSPVPVPAAQPYRAPSIEDQRSTAMLAHLLGLLTGFLGPLVIYLVARDDQPFVKHHAAESLNFQLTLLIGYIISGCLMLVLIGYLMFIALWFVGLVFTILAAVASNKGEWYRYPMNIRMVSGAQG